MHLSSVILFVSTQRWSESHFTNSLTNFIEFPSPPCSPPRNHLFKKHPPYSDFDPLFFWKKRGSNLAMLVLVSGGGGAWEVLWEFCSGARTWQRCARTRCDFRRKGWVWCGVTSRKGPSGNCCSIDSGVGVDESLIPLAVCKQTSQESKNFNQRYPKISYHIQIFKHLGIAGLQNWKI